MKTRVDILKLLESNDSNNKAVFIKDNTDGEDLVLMNRCEMPKSIKAEYKVCDEAFSRILGDKSKPTHVIKFDLKKGEISLVSKSKSTYTSSTRETVEILTLFEEQSVHLVLDDSGRVLKTPGRVMPVGLYKAEFYKEKYFI